MRDALRCSIDTRCPSYRSPSTLNVLLSFAQFEREVTSERIRDKIAFSKRIIASD
jgi:DNA invertase Pin-like site-specific DNA recombinase